MATTPETGTDTVPLRAQLIRPTDANQRQRTYLYSRKVFSNTDKITSSSMMSLCLFPSRHQICILSEASRISNTGQFIQLISVNWIEAQALKP